MSWSAADDDENASIQELRKLSDRAAAIVAGSLVDVRLTSALKQSLRYRDKDIEQFMFRPSGPLGSFSVKIKLAHLIGVLTKEAHDDLDTFKEIRNKFAHAINVRDFETQKIRDWCKNLRLIEKHFQENSRKRNLRNPHNVNLVMGIGNREAKLKNPRWRYMMTAQLFTQALLISRGSKPRI